MTKEEITERYSLTTVSSSQIYAVGYATVPVLYVVFQNDALYRYVDVPYELYSRLLESDSVGKFFNAHIKNKYDTFKVEFTETGLEYTQVYSTT